MLRLIQLFAVVALVTVVTGYFRGWFEVSKPGTDEYSVRVDRDKIGTDTKKARRIATKLSGRLTGSRVEGKVTFYNPITSKLSVSDDNGAEHAFKWTDQSEFAKDSEGDFIDLAKSARVAVTFNDVDGTKIIEKVEILED